MAFWKVYSKPWFKRKDIPNMIAWYKRKLYDDWYNSLSDEDKALQDEYLARKKKEKELKARRALETINILMSSLADSPYRNKELW